MAQQVQLTAKNAAGADQMTPEKQKIQQEYIDNSMKVVDQHFSWPVLEPAYMKLYSDTYTSGTGRNSGVLQIASGAGHVDQDAAVSAGVMEIVHGPMGDFQPKMQSLQELYVKAMAPPPAAQ